MVSSTARPPFHLLSFHRPPPQRVVPRVVLPVAPIAQQQRLPATPAGLPLFCPRPLWDRLLRVICPPLRLPPLHPLPSPLPPLLLVRSRATSKWAFPLLRTPPSQKTWAMMRRVSVPSLRLPKERCHRPATMMRRAMPLLPPLPTKVLRLHLQLRPTATTTILAELGAAAAERMAVAARRATLIWMVATMRM